MSQQVSFQTLVRSRPNVSVSSPCSLNPNHFLPKKSRGCKTSNAFMIYRKVYGIMLMRSGLPSKMTEVSRWASEAWKFEREDLKNEYREFAKRVREVYRERAQNLGVPRAILPIRPGIPVPPIREPPNDFNVEEFIQPLPDLQYFPYLTTFDPIYPLIRHDTHDIYLPQIRFEEDMGDINNIIMQDFPWISTTTPNEEDINADMDIFDNLY
jgi:hypothetical protein